VKLARDLRGISKIAFMLSLIVFFLLGAVFSYVWTMGFYVSKEFNLPSQTSMTIEDVKFFAEDPTFFNITVLNPSYSSSGATIDRIKVSTSDGKVHSVVSTLPPLPSTLAPGKSQTIKSFWDWGNYTGETVDMYVLIVSGSGPAVQAKTAFMNLTVTNVNFEPSITSASFNVTVASVGSPVSVDISEIFVNGAKLTNATPTLPYRLNPNASVTFILYRDWTDLQNETVSVSVQTKQGYVAYRSVTAPQVKLDVSDLVFFNTTATSFYFNVTVQNSASSAAKIDINKITAFFDGQNITMGATDVVPALPQTLDPNSTVVLTCAWDWSLFTGTNVTVAVYTVQGFKTSKEATIPDLP